MSARGKYYDYTRGSLGWGLTRLAVPSCGEQIAWNTDTVVELYWVGHLGRDHLAAVALVFILVFFLRAVPLGLRIAGNALVAQRVGAGDNAAAAHAAGQCILLTVLYTGVLTFLGWIFAADMMAMMTTDPRVRELGVTYMHVSFLFFVFYDGMATLAQVLRGAGEPAYSLAGMVTSAVVSFCLMPFLVFGGGPLPALGIAGAPLAVGIGRVTGAVVVLGFLFSGRSRLKLHPRHLWPDPALCRRTLSLGWPASAQNLIERGANLLLIRILSLFGPAAVAGWGIGNRVTNFSRLPSFGIQAAVRTLVGQNVGAGLPERAERTVRLAMWMLLLFMGAVAWPLFHFAPYVVAFFGLKGEGLKEGVLCLRILTFGLVFECARRVLAGAFHGAANTKAPMIVELTVRWGMMVPLGFTTAVWMGLGGPGVWGSIAAGQTVSCLFLFFWFFRWSAREGLASRRHLAVDSSPK